MLQDRLDSDPRVVLAATVIVSGPLTTSVTLRLDSVLVESRQGEDSAIFVPPGTGDSLCADLAAVMAMTLPTAIQRLESVWTVSTTPLAKTVRCALLVTMVMPLREHQKIAVAASALEVGLETSLVPLVAQLDQTLLLVTLVKLVTGEQGVKNVLTVTMVTHSFQAVAVSHVLVTTTLIRRMGAPVTEQLADVQPASTIPQASVVSAVNRVSMVTLLPGIVPNVYVILMARPLVLLTHAIMRPASASVYQTSLVFSVTSAPMDSGTWAAVRVVRSAIVVERARLRPLAIRMTASVIVSLDMEDPAVAHVKMVTGEHR